MARCINCGIESEKWICSNCRSSEDIEEICGRILKYVPGSGENELWDKIASEETGSYGFRNIVLELAEELPSPRKEYWRMLALAGGKDYLPKNEREWLYSFSFDKEATAALSLDERNLVKAFALSALIADYRYEEAEALTNELMVSDSLPEKAYGIIGDFYTKTRRYEKAQEVLEKGIQEYASDDDVIRKLKKLIFDNNERKNKTASGKPEYFPRPKENAEFAKSQYISFLKTLGIEVAAPEKAIKKAAPKPIPDDSYPDLQEIRKPNFDTFIAFDFETTGIDPRRDSIIQVGAVKVVNGEIKTEECFSELVKPYKQTVSDKITEITGIRQEDVRNAREMWEVIPDFLKFAGDNILIGYNSVDFDAKFLRRAGRYSNITIENPVFDVMRYAGGLKDQLGLEKAKIKLGDLSEKLGIQGYEKHDAYSDACRTAEVFLKLKELDFKSRLSSEELLSLYREKEKKQRIELEEKQALLNGLKEEINTLLSKKAQAESDAAALKERRDKNEIQKGSLSAEENSLQEELNALQDKKSAMQKELAGLSFVAFGKKKELRSGIEQCESSIKAAEEKLEQVKRTLACIIEENLAEDIERNEEDAVRYGNESEEKQQRAAAIEQICAGLKNDLEITNNSIAEQEGAIEKARLQAEAEAKAKAEEEARLRAEAEAKAKAEEEARMKAEAEAKAREEKRLKAEAEAKAIAEEKARKKAEAEAKAKAAEEARIKAEKEAKAKAEKEARIKKEIEARARMEAEIRAKVEAEMRAEAEAQKGRTNSSRPFIPDAKLASSVNKAFDKLEAYYPEHKVFSFDNIDSELREKMSKYYKELGYSTVTDMFAAYGYEIISGDAVKELRSFVMYTPGNEPDIIKGKVESMLRRLEEYYPDHVIPRGMQNDHKKLAGAVSGLYQWLGYSDAGEMLKAYGYEYNVGELTGRPLARDYDDLINTLVEKYKDGPKPKSMGDLLFDNPDLKGALKTLQNKSSEVFGMTLKKYFESVGIFEAKGASGSQRSKTTATVGMQDKAITALEQRYSSYQGEFSYDEAVSALSNMNVKQNKAGQIYIFRAGDCGAEVVIPYGIDSISSGAFRDQAGLETVDILAELQEIPADAFADCSSLREVSIPEGVTSIGPNAFANCSSLDHITLPKSLLQVGDAAFSGCTSLVDVEILNPMIMVSNTAFDGCPFVYTPAVEDETTDPGFFKYTSDRKGNITITGFTGDQENISIPGMIDGHPVTTIGKGAFQECRNLVSVTMSDYISTIQGAAFKDCISLKKMHISNAVSKIVSTTFRGCIGLEEVNIPDALPEITKLTFTDSPIEKLHIGKSLASIDAKAFYSGGYDSYSGKKLSTRDIRTVTIDPENPYLSVNGPVVMSKDHKCVMAALGGMKTYSIPEGVETIGNFAFEGLEFLSDVEFPESLVTIGERAFANTSIRRVMLKDQVRAIKKEAFANCQNLTAAVFNKGLEEIGDGAFIGSPVLSVYLPSSIHTLGSYCFDCLSDNYYGYRNKQELKIDPENTCFEADGFALYNVSESGKTLKSFYDRSRNPYEMSYEDEDEEELLAYTVSAGTTSIADGAFRRRNGIIKVLLPDGLETIGNHAFEECYQLKDVNIPDSVQTIGAGAFKGTAIEKFVLGENVESIGSEAFAVGDRWQNQNVQLQEIKVSENNQKLFVEQKAVYHNGEDGRISLLTYFGDDDVFEVKEGTSEISGGAFAGNDIQEVHIPSSVVTIGDQAFTGCNHLIRLRIGFAGSEGRDQYAVIYIPEIRMDQYGYYSDTRIHDYYMDCIRIAGDGELFDFVKYDSLFEGIPTAKDKILVATDRLKSDIQLVPLYRDQYLEYLKSNSWKAIQTVIEYDDVQGLAIIADLGVIVRGNIDKVIEMANKTGKVDIISFLMNYKNSEIGMDDNNPIIGLTLD